MNIRRRRIMSILNCIDSLDFFRNSHQIGNLFVGSEKKTGVYISVHEHENSSTDTNYRRSLQRSLKLFQVN